MTPQEKARSLRPYIVKASASLDDTDALAAVELFDEWKPSTAYAVDERIRYGEKLYKCVQAHTSQSNWTPDATPALWTEVAEPGTIPVWKQPTGAQDSYAEGDKVHFPDADGPVYISTVNDNVWSPTDFGWELV